MYIFFLFYFLLGLVNMGFITWYK